MRTTKITIRNLFGITERDLDGRSVELTGPKGAGKTSVLDSIRFALTNRSDRAYVIHQGAEQGEIIIETDTGLVIDRKSRTNKADYVNVRDGAIKHTRPAEFLHQIFTPLQLDPVKFIEMSDQEKNRAILNLIEFEWDARWLSEQFGEIPQGVDLSKHILEVLHDIQSEAGAYYQSRQNINRDIRNGLSLIEEIARDIPSGYSLEYWEQYNLSEKFAELERVRDKNAKIEKSRAYQAAYNDKLRGIDGERDIALAAIDREIAAEREGLTATIERLKAEIKAAEAQIAGLDERKADKAKAVHAEHAQKVAELNANSEVAAKYTNEELIDVTALAAEISNAEQMKKHINEYRRMQSKQAEVEKMQEQSDELTRKIELARSLPGEILKTATIPIAGLAVEDGTPLVNGLPVSNLSDGEILELCVDVSSHKPGQLQIILIDGAERLDTKSREALYQKCKDKGLQVIASRVTDSDDLEVTYLD